MQRVYISDGVIAILIAIYSWTCLIYGYDNDSNCVYLLLSIPN